MGGVTKQNATVTWDAMNRMTSFVDGGQPGISDTASIVYEYDKASNIRRTDATMSSSTIRAISPARR